MKGKKNSVISDNRYGYYLRAVPAAGDYSDIAKDATLRNATVHQPARPASKHNNGPAILIKPEDIMKKVRIRKNSSLVVFLLDLSWSMAVTQRLAATKKAINSILSKVYQFRDDICLITFQKDSASVVVPATHSVALAEREMRNIPIGGKTPLAAGLSKALEVMQQSSGKYQKENIIMVLLSDCDANVSSGEGDPKEEANIAADKIAVAGFRCIVINSDRMSFGEGHANRLAKRLNAPCYLIAGLNSEHLIKAVRNELIL